MRRCKDCLLARKPDDGDPVEIVYCLEKGEYIDPDDRACDNGEFDED